MINIEQTITNLNNRGFIARSFATGKEVVSYLVSQLENQTIGFGGSMTLDKLGLFESLGEKNQVFWHWKQDKEDAREKAVSADIYLTSANALAQTGEIINIDGMGNRVANTLYGKKKVYFIIGKNKIAENFEQALWRARNVAAPLNARRFQTNTPCVKGELKCYDCSSPERICKGLVVLWQKMSSFEEVEVIIIDEDFGY